MTQEIWIFSDEEQYKDQAGVVAIVDPPPELSHKEAELYALSLVKEYEAKGEEVRTVIRSARSY